MAQAAPPGPIRILFLALAITMAFAAGQGAPEAWAADYSILSRSYSITEKTPHQEILKQLRPGDVLHFPSGDQFRIGKKLGEGGTTVIFELADFPGKALRIPNRWHPDDVGEPHSSVRFLDRMIDGHKDLKSSGIPIVGIGPFKRGEYIIVDQIGPHVSFDAFVRAPSVSPPQREEMARAFEKFALSTTDFERIGDFKADQIVYDLGQKRWILLDWADSHLKLRPEGIARSATVFRTGLRRFFDDYLIQPRNADEILFVAREPELRWLANLANRVENSIQAERARITNICTTGFRTLSR